MTYMHNGMKLKKKLKDPNEKSAIQKFFGGKIPHYLAVVAFVYVLVDIGGSTLGVITGAEKKEKERTEKYILESVNKQIMMRFPQTSGPVLRTQKDNKLWTDFVEKNKNGSTNP